MPSQGQALASAGPLRTGSPLPVEIGFLGAHGVPPSLLRYAAAVAVIANVPADEVAIRHGLVPEEAFYRALARELGAPFDPRPRLAAAANYPNSILAGIAPLAGGGRFAIAPRGAQIAALLAQRRQKRPHLSVTTPGALTRAVFRCRDRTIADRAAHHLLDETPDLSIRTGATARQIVALSALSFALTFSLAASPALSFTAVTLALGLLFLGMVFLRLAAVLQPSATEPKCGFPRAPDRELPVYTVIVALHREAQVAARLVRALEALDYPRSKLDIKLVIEAHDRETRAALEALDLPGFMEVLVAPPGEPRTKPRALNVALPLARGCYTVLYDAEDLPDPGQLRLAVAAFAREPREVACLQARLTIDNTDDTWLTRLFTVEYASLFDVINPGLAALGVPLPLGGTSNHFRTASLQAIGAWDPWNVTEDADLGIRLARFGFRTGDLPSSTLEEAPQTLQAWMSQRTRWMKGFVQTCVTHSRQPVTAWRQLGSARCAGAVAMTFGTVLSALGYPIFTALSLAVLTFGPPPRESGLATLWSLTSLAVFAFGFVAILAPALVALKRRRLRRLLPVVPFLPLYYVLVSLATWRGLWELTHSPFRWNKTDHGHARTSRSGAAVGPTVAAGHEAVRR